MIPELNNLEEAKRIGTQSIGNEEVIFQLENIHLALINEMARIYPDINSSSKLNKLYVSLASKWNLYDIAVNIALGKISANEYRWKDYGDNLVCHL